MKSHNGLPVGTAPMHKAAGCVFLQSVTSFSPIACMRSRRGRPEDVPLRAEGFPKRRCYFESVAAGAASESEERTRSS